MEHCLPKEIKGLLPPNTMDTDFKAELYGALLSEAGFDTAQIMMVRDGNNLSNVSKDIRSVKHRNHAGMAEGAYIELKTTAGEFMIRCRRDCSMRRSFPAR